MAHVLYNEIDRHKAAWLRHLIEEGEIAHGIVDERSIAEIQPEDLRGVVQFHAFAGIGLWSLCLRRAGWPDDRPVWTGSCPCGPFSAAGLRKGFADPRHLWPEWFRLIGVGRPDELFGEQSSEADAWIDLVQSDLESLGYAFGAADIPAAGFGGAHRRQRFGFVADAHHAEWWSERAPWHDGGWPTTGRVQGDRHAGEHRGAGGLGYANHEREQGIKASGKQARWGEFANPGTIGGVEDASSVGREGRTYTQQQFYPGVCGLLLAGPGTPPDADWFLCRDGRHRPVEPGVAPLVDANPGRLGRLRGYGDGIDVEAFTNLIGAYMDAAPQRAAA